MIKTFKSELAKALFEQGRVEGWLGLPEELYPNAILILRILNVTRSMRQLEASPALRLISMGRKTKGYYSVRIGFHEGKEWRISFLWRNSNADEVDLYRVGG